MVYIQDHTLPILESEQGRYAIKQGIAKSFYGQHASTALPQAREYGEVY